MIHVIGFHSRALLPSGYENLIRQAQVLAGGKRHLEEFPDFKGKKLVFKSPLEEVLEELLSVSENEIAVLASGDPLFFGIGKKLLSLFPREKLAFYPAPTAFQLAFARIGIPWEDAKVISLHAKVPQNLHLEISPYSKVAFFTDHRNTPAQIARYLVEKGIEGEAIICENLGLKEEKLSFLGLKEVIKKNFSPLNVFILLKKADPLRLKFGLPEGNFAHEKGVITKAPLRARIVALLSPFAEALVWDLGAGCGSVGLELAGLCFRGKTYLVEKEKARISLIKKNLSRLRLDNVLIIENSIKNALEHLPPPDLVFIGGGFKEIMEVKDVFLAKLKPKTRVVATFVCLEHLLTALSFFEETGFKTGFEGLLAFQGKKLPNQTHYLASQNPVFILAARKDPDQF